MDKQQRMAETARNAMIHALDLAENDQVLVLTDTITRTCGEAFATGARDHGCEVTTYILPDEHRPLQELPDGLLPLLDDATVVINAIVGDAREIPFRLQWIQATEKCGHVRLGHSPGINEDMMLSGPMAVDYGQMLDNAGRLGEAFAAAAGVHITTTIGTDLTLDLRGRQFVHDLKASLESGVNLPCGEIYCCPVETGADGTLVIDGCFGSCGVVPAPVTLTVEAGRVVRVECTDEPTRAAIEQLLDTDEGARTIAELGIGLNPGARLTAFMLEAEKAYETAHIAFGSNEGMPGGQSVSQTHIDYLFTRPTMVVTTTGGEQRQVLAEGKPV